jgi:hypothetical protein
MSEPIVRMNWQVVRSPAGRAIRACRVCGQVELDPAYETILYP